MNQDLHKKIEEVMHSLDHVQRAEANHFLYGKIRNRMLASKEVFPARLLRMAVSLSVVVVMNVITVTHFYSQNQEGKNGTELVAAEYAITLPQSY